MKVITIKLLVLFYSIILFTIHGYSQHNWTYVLTVDTTKSIYYIDRDFNENIGLFYKLNYIKIEFQEKRKLGDEFVDYEIWKVKFDCLHERYEILFREFYYSDSTYKSLNWEGMYGMQDSKLNPGIFACLKRLCK